MYLRFQGDMQTFSVTIFIMAVNEMRCSKRAELPELPSGCIVNGITYCGTDKVSIKLLNGMPLRQDTTS